ncbi:hypothetical protein PC113_g17882 [Phytophthora cactorum]|uniref:Glycoside hydrolase family 3 C-terminal domain-containing protein n=1 Tax=Phytophthora cactorum TaxID=29920 RepID=A0A8T0YJQ4_9STRA|nr:hypothetical protein PC113_g17882 [Phytophthora cactorum]
MAEILYGKVNPSGRMPITYPKRPANIEMAYNHLVMSMCQDSSLESQSSREEVDVSVDVTNSCSMAGKETVMLFLIQPYRSLNVPEMKLLK